MDKRNHRENRPRHQRNQPKQTPNSRKAWRRLGEKKKKKEKPRNHNNDLVRKKGATFIRKEVARARRTSTASTRFLVPEWK